MNKITRRGFIRTAALVSAASALAACTPDQAAPPPTLAAGPTRTGSTRTPRSTFAAPAPVTPVDPQDLPDLAAIVLHRLAFGPGPGDEEAFLALGTSDEERLAAYVENQLDPESIDDSELEARFEAAGFETLHKSLEQLADEHIVNNPYDDSDDRHWEWYVLPIDELVEASFLRAVYSKRQLQELLADFWHNHFNVYGWQDDVTPLHVSYDRDVIRANLFGSFRQFLEAVASHPSMLFYLNNRSNSDAGPNENFARELFELHTLGAENYLGVRDPQTVPRDDQGLAEGYVDNDVYEAARCFTGWRVDDDLWEGEDDVGRSFNFLYYRPWHDRFNKFVLGQYIPADQPDRKDGQDVLDLLANHPGTARHIARKLCRRFVADDPPESLVQSVALAFYDHRFEPDQLRQVYRALFLSPEFRQTWRGKIKRPFEQAAAALRALGAGFTRLSGGARWTFEMMGQPVFGRHSPDGYPDVSAAWANTMATLYGWNLTTGLAQNWWSEEEDGRNVSVDLLDQTPPELRRAPEIIDFWLNRLLVRAFPEDSRQAVAEFLAGEAGLEAELSDDELGWRLPAAIELILMSPEFRYR